MKKLFILLFDQLQTDSSENVHSVSGSLWAAHEINMQEINAFEANIGSFQEISVKYLHFPHAGINFMTKDLSQIKVYTYFNIGDAKTLVKLKEK